MVDDAEDKLFHKTLNDASHVLSQLLPERRNELSLYILFVHDGMTGRYHNEPLDSLITISSHGSFLRIVISIYSLRFISVLSCVLSCVLNEYVMLCYNN